MADWKFTDDYGQQYPSLKYSVLNLLSFSSHNLNGTSFTGTLDLVSSGVATRILSSLLQLGGATLTEIAVAGTVVSDSESITVILDSTENTQLTSALAACIPLVGGSITKAASIRINTVANIADPEGDSPPTDNFTLNITIAIGSATVTIHTTIPMNWGFFFLSGEFSGVSVSLNDLNFLMGSLAGGNAWFPTAALGPYAEGQSSFGLLSLSLVLYFTPSPLSIKVSSLTVVMGISKLPLMPPSLYMDPLAVWITISDPINNAAATWGLEGSVKLLNYANQGVGGLSAPDFVLDLAMRFPSSEDPNFGFAAYHDNPAAHPVNLVIKDLIGADTNVGISDNIVVNSFELESSADSNSGEITDFSTSIVMSGGFGLFTDVIKIDEMSISLTYSS